MRLTSENTIALFIDLQEKLVPAMDDVPRLLERSRLLLSGLSVYGIPVAITRQYPKGLGDTLPEIKEVAPNVQTFDKTTFSCLKAEEIRRYLICDPRPNVLLAGIETHICVLQTALDLLKLRKRPFLVADCVSSRNPFDAQIAFKRMIQAGIVPTTVEAVLFEIADKADSKKFKTISNLVTGRK